jgi:hypothetical protein
MQRVFVTALLASALGTMPSHGQVLYPDYSNQRPVRLSAAQQGGGLGGGFIEALFGGGPLQPRPAQAGTARRRSRSTTTTAIPITAIPGRAHASIRASAPR